MAKKEANMFSFKDVLSSLDSAFKGTATIRETAETSKKRSTIGTGIYVLNAALSGSLYGGIQDNRITIFGGESGCLFPDETIKIYVMKTKNKVHNIYDTSK